MNTEKKIPVVVVGQIPPPWHGQAIVIKDLVRNGPKSLDIVHIPMQYSNTIADVGKVRPGKVLHLVSLIRKTVAELKARPESILYYPPAAMRVPMIRDIIFLLCVRRHAGAVVFHYHAAGVARFATRNPLLNFFARKAYGKANAAILLSTSAEPDGEQFNAKHSFVVPNGIDVPLVPRKADGAVLRILFVGLLSAEKGIRFLVDTAAILKERGLEVKWTCVGDWISGREEQLCRDLVKRRNVSDIIEFTGHLDSEDKWQRYADADIFYYPNRHQTEGGSPLVLIEAMAYSLPVVATNWRNINDIIEDGLNGRLFSASDEEQAADHILYLNRNRDELQRLGTSGRRLYEEKYTLAAHNKAMAGVFRTVSQDLAAGNG